MLRRKRDLNHHAHRDVRRADLDGGARERFNVVMRARSARSQVRELVPRREPRRRSGITAVGPRIRRRWKAGTRRDWWDDSIDNFVDLIGRLHRCSDGGVLEVSPEHEQQRLMLSRRGLLSLAFLVPVWPGMIARRPRVRTIAGSGQPGGDPTVAPGLQAGVNNPYGVVIGPDGALYFCEVDTGLTRRLDLRTGTISTVAGTGLKGYSGDGGPAVQAAFSAPHEIRFDRAGNLYIVERDSNVVRCLDARTKVVSTIVGTGERGFSGDGGPAAKAQLNRPHSIAFDGNGDLLICDIGNHRVRKVDHKTGTIETFAGTGATEPTPDDAPIAGTPLFGPRSIDADAAGNIYLVLREGNAVFNLNTRLGRIRRIAGTGAKGFSGDGGPALEATCNGPKGITYAPDRSLYIADTENHAIRRVDLRTGRIETVLGTGHKANGPDGQPLRCGLNRPHGVSFHKGVLYVTDSENHRIRALS